MAMRCIVVGVRVRSSGGLVVLLFLTASLLGPHAVAGGQVVDDPSAAELIESDFQAGKLTRDQRALYGTWSLMNPALLPEPYRLASPLPQADTTPAGLSFLAGWDQLSATTRSTLSDFLTLNEFRVPLVLVSGATDWPECGEPQFVDVGVVYAKAFRCKHNVFDESGILRFEVFYNVAGLDDPDLLGLIGSIAPVTAYGEPVATNNADGNGVPDAIDTISASLLKSWETYLSDGYRPIDTPQDVAVHANAAVLPGFGGSYVVQVRHDRQFHYLPRHELFHRFQYEYVSELDFSLDFLDLQSEINWWMEATAEWAAHRVGEAIEDDGGSPAESIDYALALADFLGDPSEQIDYWPGFRAPRLYGSFILAAYLEETFGDGVLEEIWAQIDQNGGKPTLAMGTEFAERQTTWADVLAGFAAANYWLDQPQFPLPYIDSDAGTVWRARLSIDPRTDGDSERGDLGLYLARPARATWHLAANSPVSDDVTLEGGGSFYFDLAPAAGAEGVIEVDVTSAIEDFAIAQLLPFKVYPDACQNPIPITLRQTSSGWHGVAGVEIDESCYFATLAVTNPDPTAPARTASWRATYFPGCSLPPTSGPNILPDGGMEAAFGYGPLGNEVPGHADTPNLDFPFLNWSDGSQAAPTSSMWYQEDAGRWFVSDSSPRTGTYHLRRVVSGAPPVFGPWLNVTSAIACEPLGWGSFLAAIVASGQTWTLTLQAKVSDAAASHRLDLIARYQDANEEEMDELIATLPTMTTSYAQQTYTAVVPDPDDLGFVPRFLNLRLLNRWSSTSQEVNIDLDDVALQLSS